MSRTKTLDLSELVPSVHYMGHDCLPVRALSQLQGATNAHPGGNAVGISIEFWTQSQTNPDKVTCLYCWKENPEVQNAYARRVTKQRTQ